MLHLAELARAKRATTFAPPTKTALVRARDRSQTKAVCGTRLDQLASVADVSHLACWPLLPVCLATCLAEVFVALCLPLCPLCVPPIFLAPSRFVSRWPLCRC